MIDIVIPAYNEEKKIERAIRSALNQECDNFRVCVYDDWSTDNTEDVILSLLGTDERLFYIKTTEHYRSPTGIYYTHSLSTTKDTIIVHLDADDYFYNSKVLQTVAQVYKEHDVWMTYGQYVTNKGVMGFCKPIEDTNRYRYQRELCVSHLRTHKAGLYHHINPEDLTNDDGNFYYPASDLSFVYPMVELCGKEKIYFIDDILYIYDTSDPYCKTNEDFKKLKRNVIDIKNKPQYKPIQSL